MLLGVDVGGTFTDAVLVDGGRVVTAKAPTTPDDQSEGVLAAVAAALERAGRRPATSTEFAHGMTVATNALLEGTRGAHRRWSPPRASPTSSSSAARPGATSTGCAPPTRRRWCRPSGASPRPSAPAPTASLRALEPARRGGGRGA